VKILAIGAHPDDVEIGCGGFLLKSTRAKDEVYIYFLTRGEAGGGGGDQREQEARISAEMIGAKDIWFGDFHDTELTPTGTLVNNIEDIIDRVNPDMILQPAITPQFSLMKSRLQKTFNRRSMSISPT
jgi:LmbE family N-acetylglucosaminyl deacetylase